MGRADEFSAPVAAHLTSIRHDLMGGRGPGASTEEVLAATRNRVEVGGMTATRRLELAARQTGLARADPDAITTVIQLREAEAACGVEENTGRLRTQRRAGADTQSRLSSPATNSTAVGLVAVVAGWVLRRASRK